MGQNEYKLAGKWETTSILLLKHDQYQDCLESIRNQSTVNGSFIVDYASPEKSVKLVHAQFEAAELGTQNNVTVKFGGFLTPMLGTAKFTSKLYFFIS